MAVLKIAQLSLSHSCCPLVIYLALAFIFYFRLKNDILKMKEKKYYTQSLKKFS